MAEQEMQKFGLIGGKLGHSLSPAIHRLFFEYTGKKASYELLETEAEALPALLRKISREYVGANVTIPHKLNVLPHLARIAPEAAAIGAVNTLKCTPEGIFGYNTDYYGFGRMLDYNEIKICGATCAVLGTGGAARAVVKYLANARAAKILLVTRDAKSAKLRDFYQLAPQLEIIGYDALKEVHGEVLTNCTPVGMFPNAGAAPVSAAVSAHFDASVDLIYNPSVTRFLAQAQAAGKKAVNGLFMLVAQAVAAQEIWQGEKYPSSLIARIMEALEREKL